jgi:hypothetical protein
MEGERGNSENVFAPQRREGEIGNSFLPFFLEHTPQLFWWW